MFHQPFLLATIHFFLVVTAERSFVDDDDDEKFVYDQVESQSTDKQSGPSSFPSTACRLRDDGSFGNTTSGTSELEIVKFRYDLRLNATFLDVTLESHIGKILQESISAVENNYLASLLSFLFEECADNGVKPINLSLNIQGISSQPKDKVGRSECIHEEKAGSICYAIDAGFSLFFDSSRRKQLQHNTKDIKEVHILIKNMMIAGLINSAHNAITSVTFIDMNVKPIDSTEPLINHNERSNLLFQGPLWLQIASIIIIMVVGGVAFLTTVAFLLGRKKKEEIKLDDTDFVVSCASIT